MRVVVAAAMILAACQPAQEPSASPAAEPHAADAASTSLPPPGVNPSPGADPAPPLPGFRSSPDCQMAGPGEWIVSMAAASEPGAEPRLVVTGTIGVKPAARTMLRLDPAVMESDPPQYSVLLDISLPREPTIDMLERRQVRGEWPVSQRAGTVHIRCGSRRVATVSNPWTER